MEGMTIGAMARKAGVNVETIRYYQRIGLLPQPARLHGHVRRYSDRDLARVRFVRAAQRLGFSLEEVAALLKLEDGMRCTEARQLAEHKLAVVRGRLADMRRVEAALKAHVAHCVASKGKVFCPLIAALLVLEETAALPGS
jgi:MerR family mercuric resistance operon transcriptional regulator